LPATNRIRHLEEVDILRTLSKAPHASVVTLLSSWEQAGRLHIQTPLAAGGDLASFLSLLADTPSPPSFRASFGESPSLGLDEGRAWKLLAALASGLAHIHKLGIIHLDIKPANVLITHDRHVVLTDFGTATCWPRKRPSEILRGSGMGTAVVDEITTGPVWEEREGDRGYLSAEAVNGVVSPAGDVFRCAAPHFLCQVATLT
jgi:mitosis inhibitor protein kinase SWE1